MAYRYRSLGGGARSVVGYVIRHQVGKHKQALYSDTVPSFFTSPLHLHRFAPSPVKTQEHVPIMTSRVSYNSSILRGSSSGDLALLLQKPRKWTNKHLEVARVKTIGNITAEGLMGQEYVPLDGDPGIKKFDGTPIIYFDTVRPVA